jgi:hypothetical protein
MCSVSSFTHDIYFPWPFSQPSLAGLPMYPWLTQAPLVLGNVPADREQSADTSSSAAPTSVFPLALKDSSVCWDRNTLA